jgi:iron complex outermembrane receptor protein
LGSFIRANTPAGTYLFDAGAGGGFFLPGGVERNLKGNELANSPNFKFSVGAQYDISTKQWLDHYSACRPVLHG